MIEEKMCVVGYLFWALLAGWLAGWLAAGERKRRPANPDVEVMLQCRKQEGRRKDKSKRASRHMRSHMVTWAARVCLYDIEQTTRTTSREITLSDPTF